MHFSGVSVPKENTNSHVQNLIFIYVYDNHAPLYTHTHTHID